MTPDVADPVPNVWDKIDMDAPTDDPISSSSGDSGSGNVEGGSKYPNELWVEDYHKGRAIPIYIQAKITGNTYLKYPGTLSETLGRSSTIPLHRTEENFDIGDHISLDACTLSAKLTLVRELKMKEELEAVLQDRQLVNVKCSLGTFEHMGIVALDFRETGYQNTLECDIKFLAVRMGTTTSFEAKSQNTPKNGGGPKNVQSSNDQEQLQYF